LEKEPNALCRSADFYEFDTFSPSLEVKKTVQFVASFCQYFPTPCLLLVGGKAAEWASGVFFEIEGNGFSQNDFIF